MGPFHPMAAIPATTDAYSRWQLAATCLSTTPRVPFLPPLSLAEEAGGKPRDMSEGCRLADQPTGACGLEGGLEDTDARTREGTAT